MTKLGLINNTSSKGGKKIRQHLCVLITASDSEVFISSDPSSSEGNCLSQKFIFPCLHSESTHQNIQLTQGLAVCMGILMQLITSESTEQKGKDIRLFAKSRIKKKVLRGKETYL